MDLDVILPDCSFPIQPKGPKQQYAGSRLRAIVQSVEPLPTEKNVLYFNPGLTRVTTTEETRQRSAQPSEKALQVETNGIGGLAAHIETINEELSFLVDAAVSVTDYHLLGPTAFLLHGPEGTGKSLLLERLANCAWQEVYHINPRTHPKGQAKALTETFENAVENQPSLILMDNLDRFLEKAEALVEQLRVELAKLEGTQVVVAAAARSVYDVDASLRTTSALGIELELLPPNMKQREDIFRQVIGPSHKLEHVDFVSLAERSHGFVGRDIHKLCGLARKRRAKLFRASLDGLERKAFGEALQHISFVTQEDFEAVIDQVQPTVLKDSILEVPKVKWTDIAGLDHVRELLENITIRPFKVRYILSHNQSRY